MYNEMMETEIKEYEVDFQKMVELVSASSVDPSSKNLTLLDTSVGSGHMLERIAELWSAGDNKRLPPKLMGSDLSPTMLALAQARLPDTALLKIANMTSVSADDFGADCWEPPTILINSFSVHHLASAEVCQRCVAHWANLLAPGGLLFLAGWEGEGRLDMHGFAEELEMFRYPSATAEAWCSAAGLKLEHSRQVSDEQFGSTFYIIASKSTD